MLYNIIYTIINSTHTVSRPRAPTNKVILQINLNKFFVEIVSYKTTRNDKRLKNRLQNNKMTRPKFSQELRNKIYNKNNGRCFHCNCVLMEERWDVDHYPVVYADIEDQCRCFPFGDVTDPLDESNLQPSCVRCNRSHKYERKKCYYCGHSQLRIRKSYIKLFFINLITTGMGVIIGKYII